MAGGRRCASTGEGKKGKRPGGAWVRPHGSAFVPRAWSGLIPWPGLHAHARCALRWCGGAVKGLESGGRRKRGRERHTGAPVSETRRGGAVLG
jgi:hypothetical protein